MPVSPVPSRPPTSPRRARTSQSRRPAHCNQREVVGPTPVCAGLVRRGLIATLVGATTIGMLMLGGLAQTSSVSAATPAAVAPAAMQCDPPAFPTGAGFEVSCNITIANAVSSAGAPSSTITATSCLAAAGVLPPFGCTTVVTTSNQLVTTVDQCNGIVVGGGSNVTCSVSVVNTVPAGGATVGVTVNQCIGSGTGGGIQPTLVCAPVASTSGATVTQCNGSGNGGGGSTRVKCTESGGATALPLSINQCNGSANGGGSTVTCTVNFTNNFLAAVPTTTTPPQAPSTPTTTTPAAPIGPTPPSAGTGGAAGPGGTAAAGSTAPKAGVGSGVTGRTGTAAGAAGTTRASALGQIGVIPFGAAQTGFGGEARPSGSATLLLPGLLALLGAGLAMVMAIRRRHSTPAKTRSSKE
jgi:hypothetical protein